jgi:hypothetical protein
VKRKVIALLIGVVITFGLGLGYYLLGDPLKITGFKDQKPAIQSQNAELRIDIATPIILEKEYSRSGKVIITEFENKQDIIGYTLDEIRSQYTSANGFSLSLKDGTLVIHQVINDWTPDDKTKCRLKEYRGMVAVYVGPDSQNDNLQKVTAIRFSTLPANIQETIQQGKYEFDTEAAINDALENLDEYF